MSKSEVIRLLKWLIAAALLAGCCLFVWSYTLRPQGGGRDGVLRLAWRTDVQSLDPAVASPDMFSAALIRAIFDGLVDYDEEMNLVPVLAEALPEVSDDGRTYRFRLRKDARFSNGRPIFAEDVVYSLRRVLDPATKSPGAGDLCLVRGARAFQDLGHSDVAGLRVVNPYTFEIELEEANFAFMHILTRVYYRVVPREEVEARGEDFSTRPVGSGPFVLAGWKRGAGIRLERNPDYPGPNHPRLESVEIMIGGDEVTHLMMFEKGELDLLFTIPSADFTRVRDEPGLGPLVVSAPQNATAYLNLNCEMHPFSDRRVRRAISLGVNRDRLLRLMSQRAVSARGVLPPLMPGYNPDLPLLPHDPEEGRRLLALAGFPDGFATTLWTSGDFPFGIKVAEAVQQDLAELRIRADVKDVSEGTLLNALMRRGTVAFSVLGWSQDYPDPSNFLEPNFLSDRIADMYGTNTCYYSRSEVDVLIRRAAGEADPAARLQLYREAEHKIVDDAPWVPLFHPTVYQLHQPWVEGFRLHPVWLVRFETLSSRGAP